MLMYTFFNSISSLVQIFFLFINNNISRVVSIVINNIFLICFNYYILLLLLLHNIQQNDTISQCVRHDYLAFVSSSVYLCEFYFLNRIDQIRWFQSNAWQELINLISNNVIYKIKSLILKFLCEYQRNNILSNPPDLVVTSCSYYCILRLPFDL